MNINDQINAIIPAAKEFGMSLTELTGEISERWSDKPTASVGLTVDVHGRHLIAGSSKWWMSPLPILLGMKLTDRQLQNIMSNCGVDAKGVETPNFGEGFQGQIGDSFVVSMYVARDYWSPMVGGVRPKFTEVTRRARFKTMAEAVAYVAANPWVQ